MIEWVDDYLENHPVTDRVLVCSYTKSAAQTIIGRWLDPTLIETERLQVATLHSFCFGQLKLNRAQVVDDDKMTEFLSGFGMDLEEGSDGVAYTELLSYAGAMGISPMEAYDRSTHPGTRGHFEATAKSYFQWKKTFGYIDFNDMLRLYTLVTKAPQLSLLVIDEAQDLSSLHWKVINHICKLIPGLRVVVAGDDDQALFAYAGVDPHGMDDFAKLHDANVRVLEQSYRVPRMIHNVAQQIAGRLSRRIEKTYDARDAGGKIVGFGGIEHLTEALDPDTDSMIIYSDKFIRQEVEEILKGHNIPYTSFSGMPAPLQTKGGMSLRAAHKRDHTPADMQTIRRGLSAYGVDIWEKVSRAEVIKRLRDRDLTLLTYHWSNADYLRRVDLRGTPNIRISTIHGAKGAEAKEVHLITGMSQGAIEHSFRDPDAPHRLMYVGVTRASESLYTYEGDNGYNIPNFRP